MPSQHPTLHLLNMGLGHVAVPNTASYYDNGAMTRLGSARGPKQPQVTVEHIPTPDAGARLRRAIDLCMTAAARAGEQVQEDSCKGRPEAELSPDSGREGGVP